MSNQDHYYLIEYSEATNDKPAILKITPFKSSERDKETEISKASTADTRLTEKAEGKGAGSGGNKPFPLRGAKRNMGMKPRP